MTPSNLIVDQRDIVWLEIIFSDGSGSKKRPALIVSNNSYNTTHLDVICCTFTSKRPKDYFIPIVNTDIEKGKPFTKDSHVRYDTILKVEKKIIQSKQGILKKIKTQEIIDAIQNLIKID